MTDFNQITNYADYIKDDPFRRGLHFPAVEAALGDVNRKRILDIGCGDGLFPRLLAERGASVVGYDRAAQRIADARAGAGRVPASPGCVVARPGSALARMRPAPSSAGVVVPAATAPSSVP